MIRILFLDLSGILRDKAINSLTGKPTCQAIFISIHKK